MPNWTATQIRFIGDHDNIVSVLKHVIVGKEFLESIKKDEFDLCKHVQSHSCYNSEDKKVCDKCEHGKFCPLLSPKGSDLNEWNKVNVDDYGLHPSNLNEGNVYFGILIPQPRGMFQGNTNNSVVERNARFDIGDWHKWNIDNWGTKWNANPDVTNLEWLDDTTAELTFWTAWSLPKPWLMKLADVCKQHNVEIEGEYADEDFCGATGEFHTDCNETDTLTIICDSMNRNIYERIWGEGSLEDMDCDEETL